LSNLFHCSKKDVFEANIEIHSLGLVFQNFGNVSGRNESNCLIKPSGIKIEKFKENDVVDIQLDSGISSGPLNPSSDTPTHLVIYNNFENVGGICHTHSLYATAWAQAGESIPCLGTTHADSWNGDIPITRDLTDDEISGNYEEETGKVIIEKLDVLNLSPFDCPGIIVANHGSFTWGKTVKDAVNNAELLEYMAHLAWLSLSINPDAKSISNSLLNKHFSRKHGSNAYYGQNLD